METKKLSGIFLVILAGSIIGTWAVTQFVFNAGGTVRINGAGATFPEPLYQTWSQQFQELTGVQVDYNGIGSGGGITQHTAKTVDFAGSDPPMKQDEWAAAPNTLHIPSTIGGVALIYNLVGIGVPNLKLNGSLIAEIFMGWTAVWDNASIQYLNPTATLPSNAITVVHRSDSSGTTAVFTSFLSDENSVWNSTYGASKTINWPTGIGQKGNSLVSGYVKTNQYTIGYCELAYAKDIGNAAVKNADDNFIVANLSTIADAADAISTSLPAGSDSWATVGNYFKQETGCGDAYPISSFSYILVYKELNVIPGMTSEKAKAVTDFIWFGIHQGQYYSASLDYVKLPDTVIAIDETSLRSITFNGVQVNDWA